VPVRRALWRSNSVVIPAEAGIYKFSGFPLEACGNDKLRCLRFQKGFVE